jgi:hypothetical protein
MEYGLRRYEAVQRLLWFLFFLLCLALAYPFGRSHHVTSMVLASGSPLLDPKSSSFWIQTNWLADGSAVGFAIVYLVWVQIVFLVGRALWLIVQYGAEVFVKNMLDSTVSKSEVHSRALLGQVSANVEKVFPVDILTRKMGGIPLGFLLHPFQRLRMMVSNPHGTLSAEELSEKERRIVETDWQILWTSWAPFRWILWVLPLLALIQTSLMLSVQVGPILTGRKELQDILAPMFASLVPVVQIIALAIVFNLLSGLMKRLENLYLSNLDTLFYDRFLSRLPFQSSDTVILLDAMQKHFHELHDLLRRLEQTLPATKDRVVTRE